MEQNQQNQIEALYSACDQLNNLFCSVYNVAVKNNAPDGLKTDLSDTVSELHNQIFRIANFIAMPASDNIAPELVKKLDDNLEFVANTFLKGIAPENAQNLIDFIINKKK